MRVTFLDRQVVSGTETGALLMWEGNFIKYRIVRPGGVQCHTAAVTSVQLIRDPESGRGVALVSGAADGKLCWWDFKTLDEAEIDMDRTTDFEIEPLHEVVVGGGVAIRSIIRGGVPGGEGADAPHALVVDSRGGLWRLDLTEGFVRKDAAS